MKKENIVEVEENGLVAVDENEKEIVQVQEVQTMSVFGDDGSEYVMALTGERKVQYSSIDKNKLSFEEKAKFFNLVNSEAKLIKDEINKTINLKDIYMEVVQVSDMATGEAKKLPRIVLISDKGESYTCSSPTFLNKLSQLINEMGQPMYWEKAIPITFKEVKTNSGFRALVFETSFK